MIEIALTTFVTLFVVIDPVGLTPVFVALTRGIDQPTRNRIALHAALIAVGVLGLFGVAGERMLQLIGIGLPAFRIAGGILLFLIAIEILFERRSQRREKSAEEAPGHDPTVFPLATPLIAGPGALASMILIMGQHSGAPATQAAVLAVMASVVLTAYMLFRLSGLVERVLGPVGINVVSRLLGMLLAALAVQFVLDGLGDVGLLAAEVR